MKQTSPFTLLLFFSLLITLMHATQVLAAHSMPHMLHKSPMISHINIIGLKKTKAYVVRRELLFTEGDELTPTLLLDSIQRLKNLRIFTKVLPFITLKENNHVELTLEIEERWTTIPFFNISSGGETFNTVIGAYDINAFGRYIEVGGQYDNWNGEHGGVAWFRNRRLFNQRILFGADIWTTKRPYTLLTSSAEKQGNYTLDQKKLNLLFEREIKLWFVVGLTLQIRSSKIIDVSTNDKIDSFTQNLLKNTSRTSDSSTIFFTRIGKLNYDTYLVNGKESRLYFKYAGAETGSKDKIKKIVWENTAFWRLPFTANAGVRFNMAAIQTDRIQDFFYVGGFKHIRGYFDGQFRSKAYWLANAEYRIPSYKSDWLVIQHIFFLDVANASNQLADLTKLDRVIYSGGTGIRIISPKVYSFNGRLDFALLSSQKTQSFISFGVQQFF